MPAEIEIKLAFPPGEAAAFVGRLMRHPALRAVRHGRARTARVVSTYFDTSDWSLAGAGIALRLRNEGGRWLQTVKGPPLPGAGGALHARPEYEWPVAAKRLDPARLATTPWRKLLGKTVAGGALAPRYTSDIERKTVPLAFADGTSADLCVDVGAIRVDAPRNAAARRVTRVPVAEIEIELVAGDPLRLFELAQAFAVDLPLSVGAANKAARGYALARGWPDGWRLPVRAADVTIDDKARADEALAAIAAECLHQIAANAAGLLCDRDPEWVHQMRIGTRRLRSCLALDAGALPPDRLDSLLVEIKWLAGILGCARDWDVFATETVPPLTAHFAHDAAAAAGLRRLRARAAAQRRAARTAAVDAVRSPRFQQLVLATGALCTVPRTARAAPGAPDAPNPVALPAKAFARALLARRHRKLLRRTALLAHGTREERHAVRIAAKKLRYAAEFFAPMFPPKRAREYLGALAALQDVLGRYNDGATATRLALAIDRGENGAAAGIVRGWVAAQAAALEPELATAHRRFAKAKRFWT